MSALCPHCGYDLETDRVLEMDGLMFDPRGPVIWRGELVHLTPSERIMLHTLLKAAPRTVTKDVILERVGSDGPPNSVNVWAHGVRSKLDAIAPGHRIKTDWARGYRWAA